MNDHWRALTDWFSRLDEVVVAVAWSGGVDSSLAALAAHQALGDLALALVADTPLVPAWERLTLAGAANGLGLRWNTVPVDLLANDEVAANGPDRCYHCKRTLMSAFLGLLPDTAVLADGTNADDDPDRPGRRALVELGVRSPLAEIGLGKAGVRSLARELGLPMADRPSESCLATRVRGPLTRDRLALVEQLESLVRAQGVTNCRVRVDELTMSIETSKQDKALLEIAKPMITTAINRLGLAGYEWAERPELG